VPSEFTLFDLHSVIQVAMGWDNSHLHEFTIKRQKYSLEGPDDFGNALSEDEAILRDVVRVRSKFRYQYDFGDSWHHIILVEKVTATDDAVPLCVDGGRACPPEGCGGAWGYSEMLDALKSPNEDEREDAQYELGDDFDPDRFEKDAVNRRLAQMFGPAPAKKKTRQKRK
jgi:hypothetical protein